MCMKRLYTNKNFEQKINKQTNEMFVMMMMMKCVCLCMFVHSFNSSCARI